MSCNDPVNKLLLRSHPCLKPTCHSWNTVLVRKRMAVAKKARTQWDFDEERQLIEIWAGILHETNGKVITKKKKEALATQLLNWKSSSPKSRKAHYFQWKGYSKQDRLNGKKGKNFYLLYRKRRKTGDEVDPNLEIELNIEAAGIAWPNLNILWDLQRTSIS